MPQLIRPIVIAAHGTRSEAGQRTSRRAAAALAEATGAQVTIGWIDVLEPTVDEVTAALEDAVIVPWLVGGGFHLQVDVARALAANPSATALATIGDSEGLLAALVERVGEVTGVGTIALVWAGSRNRIARARVGEIAATLAHRVGRDVVPVALAAGDVEADVALGQVVSETSGNVAAVSLLLAPGFFHDTAVEMTARHGLSLTDPIGDHPALVAAVASEYAALAGPSIPE